MSTSAIEQLIEYEQDGNYYLADQAASELNALRAVVEAARGLLRAVDGFGPVGSVYEKRNELESALARVDGKGEK